MKEFVAFFQRIMKSTIVMDNENGVVKFSGRGHGNPSELVAGCLEHALRVCREGQWKV